MARVFVRADQGVLDKVAREVSMTPGQLWDSCLRYACDNLAGAGLTPEQARDLMVRTYGERPIGREEMN